MRMQFRRQRRAPVILSLHDPIEAGKDNGGLTIVDVIPDEACMEQDAEQRDLLRRLRCSLTALPLREQRVLTLRYGLDGTPPQTQLQTAQKLHHSRSYVSRLEARALARLRQQAASSLFSGTGSPRL